MTKANQTIGTSDRPYFEGDTLRLEFSITDESTGSSVDLTGMTAAAWVIFDHGGNVLLTKGMGSGINLSGTSTVQVEVDKDDTLNMAGSHFHELEIVDASDERHTLATGTITITRSRVVAS